MRGFPAAAHLEAAATQLREARRGVQGLVVMIACRIRERAATIILPINNGLRGVQGLIVIITCRIGKKEVQVARIIMRTIPG